MRYIVVLSQITIKRENSGVGEVASRQHVRAGALVYRSPGFFKRRGGRVYNDIL